jgi:hypothetical protein
MTPLIWKDTFSISGSTTADQTRPAITATPDGGFAVVWDNFVNVGTIHAVAGQIFDAFGNMKGGQFTVSSELYIGVNTPDIDAYDNGQLLVAWGGDSFSSSSDNDGCGIWRRLLDADGTAIDASDMFTNSIRTAGNQDNPTVAAIELTTGPNNDPFLITWEDVTNTQSEFRLESVGGGNLSGSNGTDGMTVSAALDGGRSVLVRETDNGADGVDLQFVVFNAQGVAVNGSIFAPGGAGGSEVLPAVTALENGGFVIVWVDNSASAQLRAQVFDGSGFLVSNGTVPISIDGLASGAEDIKVAGLAGGGFVVVWELEEVTGATRDIVARVFDNNGVATGSDFRVTGPHDGVSQTRPDVAGLDDGRFVVTWEQPDGGGGADILGKIFDPRGSVINGDNGNDVILGRQGDTTIYGMDGDDVLTVMNGDDLIFGEAGNDVLIAGDGDDVLLGGSGTVTPVASEKTCTKAAVGTILNILRCHL